eukprot:5703-Heterococcus_DN1.PRE.4
MMHGQHETSEAELRNEGQTLAPSSSRRAEFARAVGQLNTELQGRRLLLPNSQEGTLITKIIKAGSLGKNTSLVHSDADIVVFVRNIKGAALDLQHTKNTAEASNWFVAQQPEYVKLLIVSVKWRVLDNPAKFKVQLRDGKFITVSMREHAHAQGISTYVVELLVIAVYNSLKEAEPSLTTVYERLYNLVSNPHSLKVYFPPQT